MSRTKRVGWKLAGIITDEVRDAGHDPADFFREHQLVRTMWRIRTGKGYTCSKIMEIIKKTGEESVNSKIR